MKTRIKCILPGMSPPVFYETDGFGVGSVFEWDGMQFIHEAECRDYDWLVVYDDMPKRSAGSIVRELEPLACPRERTILVTAEPPSIKLYTGCYTRQFGYVLTTHDYKYLPHRNYRRGQGCLRWMASYTQEMLRESDPHPVKEKLISTCCTYKAMKHTQHFNRLQLTRYVSERLPELDWYGWGVRKLEFKYDALFPYKYHIAVENYIHPYHWSDKISDPILGLCLTFYAGDPCLGEVLPEESFIRIPIDDPPAAMEIIQTAIRNNEYEKRLPAIREARRRILSKYNLYSQVAEVVRQHPAAADSAPGAACIKGRHRLRRNPINALEELFKLIRFRIFQKAR